MCASYIYIYIYDAEQLATSPDVSWHPARVAFQVKARPFTKASPLYQNSKMESASKPSHNRRFLASVLLIRVLLTCFYFQQRPKNLELPDFFGQLDETPYDQQWHLRSRCVGSMSVFATALRWTQSRPCCSLSRPIWIGTKAANFNLNDKQNPKM